MMFLEIALSENQALPPMKKLGLGVLGLGEGRSIISAGVASELWTVAGICDLDESLRAARMAEFGLECQSTASYDELLANPEVDVVGIYTPDHLHAGHVLKAIKAGKHVVCTKPFLDKLELAKELLDAQAASGKQVMVGQSSRFFAPFARQREHFESGVLGGLNTIEAYYHADHRWFLKKGWSRSDAFKWLYGCISHPGDLVRWYLPDIEEVFGYASLSENGRGFGLAHPDTFHFVLKSKGGITARVSGSYSTPVVPIQRDSNMSCILRCNEGASQADYYDLRYSWKAGGKSCVETFEDQDDYFFRFGGHSHHAGEYQNYIEHLARCIHKGVTAFPDAREGVGTVALMQAMEESYLTGKPVRPAELLSRHGLSL